MKISEIKQTLKTLEAVNFELPNGGFVPESFHVTEIGVVTKKFIDCGGKLRTEKVANFQLWNADDYEHRLKPAKLIHIIELSEKVLGLEDLNIEVEFQADTIGKYDLAFNGTNFILENKYTACLAMESCCAPTEKVITNLSSLQTTKESHCTPGGGCC
jgi:hypothetical protein